jgi:RNA polymerase sigma factor (sigma-70 family)
LASLTGREREVFVLRDLEGLDSAEIATILGIGESTVRSFVTLSRRRLRALLGPRLFPEARSGGSSHG